MHINQEDRERRVHTLLSDMTSEELAQACLLVEAITSLAAAQPEARKAEPQTSQVDRA